MEDGPCIGTFKMTLDTQKSLSGTADANRRSMRDRVQRSRCRQLIQQSLRFPKPGTFATSKIPGQRWLLGKNALRPNPGLGISPLRGHEIA